MPKQQVFEEFKELLRASRVCSGKPTPDTLVKTKEALVLFLQKHPESTSTNFSSLSYDIK